jgi:hypothetical protein
LSACPNLDLSLFTVARLSASFTYVTPVSVAAPPKGSTDKENKANPFCFQQHLADGGYYDDDGMASAMEFLWSAFTDEKTGQPRKAISPTRPSKIDPESPLCKLTDTCDQVYLIEIRNTEEPRDPSVLGKPEARTDTKKPVLGHVVEQLTSPITTLFDAWDVAQPTRNQREYLLLKSALRDQVIIHHSIFDFRKTDNDEKDPLSWHLTARDKEKIECEWRQLFESSARDLAAKFPSSSGVVTSRPHVD